MLLLKSVHILFVIAWMAGLFYMPRIMVHYVEGREADEDVRRLVTMLRKLFYFSSMMAVVAMGSGIALWLIYGFGGLWLWTKLALVALLAAYHHVCMMFMKRMQSGAALPGGMAFRVFNEGALIIVFPIILLVVMKPF